MNKQIISFSSLILSRTSQNGELSKLNTIQYRCLESQLRCAIRPGLRISIGLELVWRHVPAHSARTHTHSHILPSAKTIRCPERHDSLAIFRLFLDIFRFCFDQLVQALRKCPMFEEMKEHFCAVGGFSFLLHGAVRFCAGYFKSKEMVCLAIFSYFLEVAQIGTLPQLNVKF